MRPHVGKARKAGTRMNRGTASSRIGLLGVGLGVVLLGVAACSGGSSGGSGGKAATGAGTPTGVASPTPIALPAGFTRVTGQSFQFGLPATPAYKLDARTIGDSGELEQRWRYAVTPAGPFCQVLAIEQKNFTGDWPQSSLQLFAAGTQPGQKTLRNEVLRPTPAGATGALAQESTFTTTLADGSSVTNHLYQRVYLTPGRSLIQLLVGGPEEQAASCRYTDILATFGLTGHEFTGAPDGLAPIPGAGGSGSGGTPTPSDTQVS